MKHRLSRTIYCSLRKYRKTRGLKQKEVATIIGLKNPGVVSRWEKGICLPKSENMFKLAVLYRTMVDALYIDLRKRYKKEIFKAEEELLKSKK